MKRVVLVLGMHRSGTSLVSSILEQAGVDFGNDLLPPMSGINDRGFWEHEFLVSSHENLLRCLGSSWYDIEGLPKGWEDSEAARDFVESVKSWLGNMASGEGVLGLKDPRMCLFLPLWERVFCSLGLDISYVVVRRDPREVALSLFKRDGIPPVCSFFLYEKYTVGIEQHVNKKRTMMVDYGKVLEDPKGESRRMAGFLGFQHHNSDVDVENLVDASLYRCRVNPDLGYDLTVSIGNSVWPINTNYVAALMEDWGRRHRQTIEYQRRIHSLSSTVSDLGEQLAYAHSVIREKDSSIKSLVSRLDDLGKMHAEALKVIKERDSTIERLSISSNQATRDVREYSERILGLEPGDQHYMAYVGPPGQYDFMGATQFRLLCSLGLRAHHYLLDFGCGSLRAGRFFLLYLDVGRYFGLEPNQWLIEEAVREEIGRDILSIKKPKFSNDPSFDAGIFDRKFDFILAQSIFSHTGLDILSSAFRGFFDSLSDDGIAACTFVEGDEDSDKVGWEYPGCVCYTFDTLKRLAEDSGLKIARIPWYHPRQKWFLLAKNESRLPGKDELRFLSGAVLFDPEFGDSRI